ncbi:hypothetical protein [Hymenobacter sp. B81]|uniref:hypothetical protein n=1 Tax=Hymenobacter sp. B81 TaxID=3344878 RepID=UPI0037DD0779
MPHLLKLLLAAASLAVFLGSCKAHRNPRRHVTFAQLKSAAQPAARTIRLYLDARGDLYPDEQLPTDAALRRNSSSFFLSDYYLQEANRPQLLALCRRYGVPTPAAPSDDDSAWQQVQTRLVEQHTQALNTLLASSAGRPLVILIHGFNVRATSHTAQGTTPGLYDAVRGAMTAAAPAAFANAVFLEVFWDGLQKDLPVGIWAAAQLNARYAGVRLRQVVAGTAPTTPIRVFTHSSGAIVATHTFWNVTSPYTGSGVASIAEFQRLYRAHPTPTHPDVRLGLLVPATTGNAFFGTNPEIIDYLERTPPTAAPPTRHVTIGMNERDYALNKAGLSPPSKFGTTTLGCRPWDYKRVEDAIGSANLDSVHFWYPKNGKPLQRESSGFRSARYEAHGWETYLSPQRRHNFTRFVRRIMQQSRAGGQ